jgi:hypothetical protein
MRSLGSEVFDVAGGDVIGWVGVQAQVAVVGVPEAPLEFGAVVPGCFREPVPEGVAQVVRPERAESAFAVGDLSGMDAHAQQNMAIQPRPTRRYLAVMLNVGFPLDDPSGPTGRESSCMDRTIAGRGPLILRHSRCSAPGLVRFCSPSSTSG